jgi:hypothetical protein
MLVVRVAMTTMINITTVTNVTAVLVGVAAIVFFLVPNMIPGVRPVLRGVRRRVMLHDVASSVRLETYTPYGYLATLESAQSFPGPRAPVT